MTNIIKIYLSVSEKIVFYMKKSLSGIILLNNFIIKMI